MSNPEISGDDLHPGTANAPKAAEWRVYFDGDFTRHIGHDRVGTEYRIGQEFEWYGCRWLVPAVYSCGKGLIVDFCARVDAQRIREFMDRWALAPGDDDEARFTDAELRRIEAENPLNIDFQAEATVNRAPLRPDHGMGLYWNPCVPDGYEQDRDARAVVEHYGLDRDCGWMIWRQCFLWATRRRPALGDVAVRLSANMTDTDGPHFRVGAAGERIEFVWPRRGTAHVLTVLEYERQVFPHERFGEDAEFEFPTHFTEMSYTIEPDLPDEAFAVQDCRASDSPRRRQDAPGDHDGPVCIGIIGGAFSPTALVLGAEDARMRAACSGLRFAPDGDVEWKVVFREKSLEDMDVRLI